MIQTLILPWASCVRCGGSSGQEIVPGDTVIMLLRTDADSELPDQIEGSVVLVDTPIDAICSRIYTITYDDEDLTGVDLLLACMVSAITCVDCCSLLQSQIDVLDTRLTAAELTLAEHETRIDVLENDFTVTALHSQDLTTDRDFALQAIISGHNTTGPYTYQWFDPADNMFAVDAAVSISGTTDPTFMGGIFRVTVTDITTAVVRTASVYVPRPEVRSRTLVVDDLYGSDTAGQAGFPEYAFQTIQAALAVATEADVIEVNSQRILSTELDGSLDITIQGLVIKFNQPCAIEVNLTISADFVTILGPAASLQGTLNITGDSVMVNIKAIFALKTLPGSVIEVGHTPVDGISITGDDVDVEVQYLYWRIDVDALTACGIRLTGCEDTHVRVTRLFHLQADGQPYSDGNAFIRIDESTRSTIMSHDTEDLTASGAGPWLIRTVMVNEGSVPCVRSEANVCRLTGRTRTGKMISGFGAVGMVVIADSLESTENESSPLNGHWSSGVGLTAHDTLNTVRAWIAIDSPTLRLRGTGSPVSLRNNSTVVFDQPTIIQWGSGALLRTNHTAVVNMTEASLYLNGGLHKTTTAAQLFLSDAAGATLQVQANGPVVTSCLNTGMGGVTVTGHAITFAATVLHTNQP